jgi:hypothetical protein
MITVELDELEQPFMHVPMESLTTDRFLLRALVSHMTCGAIEVDDAYLDHIMAQGPVDPSGNGRGHPSHTLAARWPDWKQDLWRRLDDAKGARERYAARGYDVPAV